MTNNGARSSKSPWPLAIAGTVAILLIGVGAYALGGGTDVAGAPRRDGAIGSSLANMSGSSEADARQTTVPGTRESTSTSTTSSTSTSTTSSTTTSTSSGVDAATATSLAAFGGMAGLEEAAIAEGQLNLIALPPGWVNYRQVIDTFRSKYPEIEVIQTQPDASSVEELDAADELRGTDEAPDVFDVSRAVAESSTDYFAPYKVAAWGSIPSGNYKEKNGRWVTAYAGTMTIGYDAARFGEITLLENLLDPKFAGQVALSANPTKSISAYNGVVMCSLTNGGSLDDISKGVDFFLAVKAAGNLAPESESSSFDRVAGGELGLIFDWSYNMPAYDPPAGTDWRYFIPTDSVIGNYYNQAISIDAPHPAAARLWEEFLYTPQVQNLWLAGGANPVLQETMKATGTVDPAAQELAISKQAPQVQSQQQIDDGFAYLDANWSRVTG